MNGEGTACESCGVVVDDADVVAVVIPNGAWSGEWDFCPDCAGTVAHRPAVAA